VFKALASPVGAGPLFKLYGAPATTGEPSARFEALDRCTVMQHLNVLEDADLVIAERRGRERWNHLNAMPIKEIHDRWIGPYARQAVSVLKELKDTLES